MLVVHPACLNFLSDCTPMGAFPTVTHAAEAGKIKEKEMLQIRYSDKPDTLDWYTL